MARRKRTGNRTFPKRAKLWLPIQDVVTVISTGVAVQTGDLLTQYFAQTGAELPVGSTIGPIRGMINVTPSVGSSFDLNQTIFMALQLTPEGGRAQVAIPDLDIMDAMWYGQIATTETPRESSAGTFQTPGIQREFMTKAKRKITGNGQQLVFTAVPATATDFLVRVNGMVMVALP